MGTAKRDRDWLRPSRRTRTEVRSSVSLVGRDRRRLIGRVKRKRTVWRPPCTTQKVAHDWSRPTRRTLRETALDGVLIEGRERRRVIGRVLLVGR